MAVAAARRRWQRGGRAAVAAEIAVLAAAAASCRQRGIGSGTNNQQSTKSSNCSGNGKGDDDSDNNDNGNEGNSGNLLLPTPPPPPMPRYGQAATAAATLAAAYTLSPRFRCRHHLQQDGRRQQRKQWTVQSTTTIALALVLTESTVGASITYHSTNPIPMILFLTPIISRYG